MELSILIPVYNYDVNYFVNELNTQCSSLKLQYEIIVLDDCSDVEYHLKNKKLVLLNHLIYSRLDENLGRSKIRNELIKRANFKNCLILDCDLRVDNPDFISNYLEKMNSAQVIIGGHCYDKKPPIENDYLLHWKYGVEVESLSLNKRRLKPYDSFKTNSFLIKKKVFDKVKFNEKLKDYGHEDTLYGIELELNNISIQHIDNPVVHIGLEESKTFLKKQKLAIKNLIFLVKYDKYKTIISDRSKLLSYEFNFVLIFVCFLFPNYAINNIYKRLIGKNPKIRVLNFWKLMVLKELRRELTQG